jgi:hypothetical protein
VRWIVKNVSDTAAAGSWTDRVYLSTDATWRGSTKTRFGPSGVSPSSIPDRIDARRDSGDWTLAGFDDSAWERPIRVDGRQWGPLGPRTVSLLRETEIKPLMLIEHQGKTVRLPLAKLKR